MTTAPLEKRLSYHRSHRKWVGKFNAGLSEWLQECTPIAEPLAVVPEPERYEREAEITREMRKHHDLFNILDGKRHTKESIARILAGRAKAKASRESP